MVKLGTSLMRVDCFHIGLTVLLIVISLGACGPFQHTSPFDVGPIGPADPIFDKYNPNRIKNSQKTTSPTLSKSSQEPGTVANYPGLGINRVLIPPRITNPNQPPAETFGSAIGRTPQDENQGTSARPAPQNQDLRFNKE